MQYCLLVSLLAFLFIGINGSGIHLSVSSNWQDSPLIFELSEALSYLPSNSYSKFFSQFPDLTGNSSPKSDYEKLWEIGKNLTTQVHHQHIIEYAIASRFYNPTISSHL